MRFVLIHIPNGYETAPPDAMPDTKLMLAMIGYIRELQDAGVLLSIDGFRPPSSGVRVHFSGGAPEVVEGPFPDTPQSVGGFWIIDVPSKTEAVEWACRCPDTHCVIEVREVQEVSGFPENLRAIAEGAGPIGKQR
jgi:hypothetical protein